MDHKHISDTWERGSPYELWTAVPPSSVAGVEPSERFLKTAKENLADRATLRTPWATLLLDAYRESMEMLGIMPVEAVACLFKGEKPDLSWITHHEPQPARSPL